MWPLSNTWLQVNQSLLASWLHVTLFHKYYGNALGGKLMQQVKCDHLYHNVSQSPLLIYTGSSCTQAWDRNAYINCTAVQCLTHILNSYESNPICGNFDNLPRTISRVPSHPFSLIFHNILPLVILHLFLCLPRTVLKSVPFWRFFWTICLQIYTPLYFKVPSLSFSVSSCGPIILFCNYILFH
jgi:hypothetical protein